MQKKKEKKKKKAQRPNEKEKEKFEGLAITPEDVTSLLERILRFSRALFSSDFISDGVPKRAWWFALLLTNMRHRRVEREELSGVVSCSCRERNEESALYEEETDEETGEETKEKPETLSGKTRWKGG